MVDRRRLTAVDTVRDHGSWVCTVETNHGELDEVVLLPCDDPEDPPVKGWINRCMHEDQRLHRDHVGAIIRDNDIVCPRHGSHFDTCSGDCDDGEAAGTTLIAVDLDIASGQVYLVDDEFSYQYDGPIDDDDDGMPSSTSHIQF